MRHCLLGKVPVCNSGTHAPSMSGVFEGAYYGAKGITVAVDPTQRIAEKNHRHTAFYLTSSVLHKPPRRLLQTLRHNTCTNELPGPEATSFHSMYAYSDWSALQFTATPSWPSSAEHEGHCSIVTMVIVPRSSTEATPVAVLWDYRQLATVPKAANCSAFHVCTTACSLRHAPPVWPH